MSRIINRQRQLAEAGRLRLGFTDDSGSKPRPVRSETWIFTSHSQDLVIAAADQWGGTPESWQPLGNGAQQHRVITEATTIDAILPPGDPLTQAYEMWSRGGAQRRCDGVTEQFSGSPCLCVQQFGDTWYEQSARQVCGTKTRLKVLLPDMPGLGSYRVETGSYYAADEIVGMVDTIRGAVGDQALVPVSMRIEQRTRVAGGQTKQFVVPVLELRGVTAGELLSGSTGMRQLGSSAAPSTAAALEQGKPALEQPAPSRDELPDYPGMARAADTLDDWREVWDKARAAGHLTEGLKEILTGIGNDLKKRLAEAPAPHEQLTDNDGVVDAEIVPDAPTAGTAPGDVGALLQEVITLGGTKGMDMWDIEAAYAEANGGLVLHEASVEQLAAFRIVLEERAA